MLEVYLLGIQALVQYVESYSDLRSYGSMDRSRPRVHSVRRAGKGLITPEYWIYQKLEY